MAEYRLAALLVARKSHQEACQVALGEAVADVARARVDVEEAEQRVASALRRRVTEARSRERARTAGELASAHAWDARLVGEIGLAKEAVAGAEARAGASEAKESECREALALATRERQAIEKHRDAWEAKERKAREKRAEEEADERNGRKG
jgi:hypothetical protein